MRAEITINIPRFFGRVLLALPWIVLSIIMIGLGSNTGDPSGRGMALIGLAFIFVTYGAIPMLIIGPVAAFALTYWSARRGKSLWWTLGITASVVLGLCELIMVMAILLGSLQRY